jgi:hypothetical protein
MFNMGLYVNNFQLVLYQFPDHLERTFLHHRTAGSPRKTMVSVIFCWLLTFSIWDRPKIYISALFNMGLYVNNFQLVLYQFPDHLERTFLHHRTAGCTRKTMVSVIFCVLLTFSIWDRPKIYISALFNMGLYVNNFQLVLYQFPDHLERTFLHNRTAGSRGRRWCRSFSV